MPTFAERHGMRACMVAPTKIIAGLGMSLGIDRLDAPGTTGMYSLSPCVHGNVVTVQDYLPMVLLAICTQPVLGQAENELNRPLVLCQVTIGHNFTPKPRRCQKR